MFTLLEPQVKGTTFSTHCSLQTALHWLALQWLATFRELMRLMQVQPTCLAVMCKQGWNTHIQMEEGIKKGERVHK